jgi:GT2 family glycosyltransferase/glycosyltransferase involved in cell wall biosynthesis
MYLTHVVCVRRQLFSRLGGFRRGFEGCQDYDFALRATEQARKIAHVPKILYHWRSVPASTAANGAAKPEAFERGIRAVQEALARRGLPGQVERPDFAVKGNLGIFHVRFPDDGPLVSILIPTRNQAPALRRCVQSVLQGTTYRNFEIIILDDDSNDPETKTYLAGLPGRCRALHLHRHGRSFNFARLNNQAVEQASGDYVLFLNDDTEVQGGEWLSQMVGHAQIPGVGAVGARLLYPDGRIQHAGVTMGLHGGLAGHAFKLLPRCEQGYLSHARLTRNYVGVTAACMLIRRQLFRELGGFDEKRFGVAYNDVEFCLRLHSRGLRSVYVPDAELTHYEGRSRGFVDNPRETLGCRRLYEKLGRDPYHNPNLSLENELCEVSSRRSAAAVDSAQLPIRVGLFSHNLNLEGAPLFFYELAAGLKARGRVLPEVHSPEDGPLAEMYRRAGIPVHVLSVPFIGVQDIDQLHYGSGILAAWMQEMDFQVIHANTLNTFYALTAAQRAGLPSIWSVHESVNWTNYFDQFGPIQAKAGLDCFARPYQIVFAAQATRDLFQALNSHHNFGLQHYGLPRERMDDFYKNHTAARAKQLIGCPLGKKAITIVGTVCQRKGQHDFVRAAVQLLESGRRDVIFYVVGCRPSPYLEEIRRLIDRHTAHIQLIHETEAVYCYLRASDIFVCCSYSESFPRVILEAMAFRLPIVTTPAFGIAEQIKHGASALTFRPGDVAGLALHLERLLDDPAECGRLGDGAAAALGILPTYQEMVENYERMMLEAYSSGGPKSRAIDSPRVWFSRIAA